MDRHTPGPWSVDDYGAGQRIVVKGRQGFSGDYRVADAHFSSDLANCVRVAEMQANARLIAAAPELLEWGAELLTLLDDYMQVTSLTANLRYAVALGMFRKAIAKAEGRQSTSMEGGEG